jgi:hypothetical protein
MYTPVSYKKKDQFILLILFDDVNTNPRLKERRKPLKGSIKSWKNDCVVLSKFI